MIAEGYEKWANFIKDRKTMKTPNEFLREDLIRLRDELVSQAVGANSIIKDHKIAEVIFKINSCLFSGYPKKVK